MKEIVLSQGKVALVDDEDFEWLSQWKWSAHRPNPNRYYAIRQLEKTRIGLKMHRVILGLDYGDKRQGDHINGDSLDNRRANLRIALPIENARNCRMHSNNSSGFNGVSFHRNRNKWLAQYSHDRIRTHIGYFVSKVDAAQAFMFVTYLHYGEFSRIN